MRVLFVQYAGDFREAYQRLADGGEETYRAQRQTVEGVAGLAARFGAAVGTLVYVTKEPYTQEVAPGVEAIGMGFRDHPDDFGPVWDRIAAWRPTHLVQRCLTPQVLEQATRAGVRTLVVAADLPERGGVRNWWRNRRLARLLNRPGVEWVAHHHLSATRSLVGDGVEPAKLIPYDYDYPVTPDDFPARELRNHGGPAVLGYAGMVIEDKGVPDLLAAAARLNGSGFPVRVRAAGGGDLRGHREMAERLGVGDAVEFLGAIPNGAMIDFIRSVDALVVPSRHTYTESFGFVVQEGLLARTPLIASDHRAFRGRVADGEAGLVFPAGDADALAERARRLLTDPALYRRLSENAAAAWERSLLPIRWCELIRRWLADTPEDTEWLRAHTLAGGLYTD